MNVARVAPRIKKTIVGKPKACLLPVTAKITIPPGLDWVVRQRLAKVAAFAIPVSKGTHHRADELCRLAKALSQNKRKDVHQVTLWGYELAILYSFLRHQEQHFTTWGPDQIPPRALCTIRADLRGLLPKLHAICRGVDVYADRPAHDR